MTAIRLPLRYSYTASGIVLGVMAPVDGNQLNVSQNDRKEITPVISDRFRIRMALAKDDIWSIRLPSRDGDVSSLHTFSSAFWNELATYL
jgi:hypothetical protein